MRFVATDILVKESLFARNIASQGGVFFAIQKSTLNIEQSFMVQNAALDASVMYGLSNQEANSLYFNDCVFSENYGHANTIHMLLSTLVIHNSTFINNYA